MWEASPPDPGPCRFPLDQELARLMPFLQEAVRWQVPISVDTYKPEVMQAALDMGVDIVNDIWALRQTGCRASGCWRTPNVGCV